MSTHSKDGREWAKLSMLKTGDKVTLDSGFTCGIAGLTLEVTIDEKSGPWVTCRSGRHFLDANIADESDHLVGVWPA